MFFGEYYKSLDDKGRVGIPREFRDLLVGTAQSATLVITKNMDGGLTAYPADGWESFAKRLEECADVKMRTALNRLYLAPKTAVQLDKQGRIPLGKAQRKWAGLSDEVREIVVVGNFDRIDIFSPERYREVVSSDVEMVREDLELINKLNLP